MIRGRLLNFKLFGTNKGAFLSYLNENVDYFENSFRNEKHLGHNNNK